jgi:hypothetical protein
VFDDVAPDKLMRQQADIAAGALDAARMIASAYLADGPGQGIAPTQITQTLVRRDSGDSLYERLAPFERQWAVLVIRLLHPSVDADTAVRDALARGATWANIAHAIGTSRQTAFNRFGAKTRR